MANHLYYGDNLRVLRESIADESVDLIYLDPPFNSNASYNVLFRGPQGNDSTAQIEAFDDTWHWTDSAEEAFAEVMGGPSGAAAEMLRAMRAFLGENDMMAYLAMMAVRMLELHRVLKPTGSLYLHCDPAASHYLKILLDAVFGAKNFRNEVVWQRTSSANNPNRWGPVHDTIFFYWKSSQGIWNKTFQDYSEKYISDKYKYHDERGIYRLSDLTASGVRKGDSGKPWMGHDPNSIGRHWGVPRAVLKEIGDFEDLSTQEKLDILKEENYIYMTPGRAGKPGFPQLKRYLQQGQPIQDTITDIPPVNSMAKERLGYPTQKPVALLERIVAASSNEGDVVLDPFCGCGTTVHAAQKLGRRWIGIDVTHLAIGLIDKRLREAFEDVAFETHGVPTDLGGARALAEADKHEFEKWALSLIDAQPGNLGKKGADGGFDGNKYFGGKKDRRAVVSVKGGRNVGVGMVRDLDSVVSRLSADVGILLTLTEPTKPMVSEAAAAGHCTVEGFDPVPRLQIVTVEQALALRDRAVRLPFALPAQTRKAAREKQGGQGALDI